MFKHKTPLKSRIVEIMRLIIENSKNEKTDVHESSFGLLLSGVPSSAPSGEDFFGAGENHLSKVFCCLETCVLHKVACCCGYTRSGKWYINCTRDWSLPLFCGFA